MTKNKIGNFLFKKTKRLLKKSIRLKIPYSLKLYQFLLSNAKTDFTLVNGNKMYLDSEDSLNLSIENFEPIETSLIKKIVKPNDIVLDIGANIGYYTLLLARQVGPHGRVFAFEPEPNNFKILQKNVKINKFHNAKLNNVAVSNENGKINLFLSDKNKGMHRIYPSELCSDDFIEVNMIKLDDELFFQKMSEKISFIKIDVEGYELQVLKGMEKILNKNSKVKILLEFIPASILEAKQNPKKLLEFLQEKGFIIKYINKENKTIETSPNNNFLLEKFSDHLHSNSKGTNLFCIKN